MHTSLSGRESLAFLAPVSLVMLAAFVVPLGFIFSQSVTVNDAFSLVGFADLFASPLFYRVFWTTFEIAIIASLVALLAGYPVALHISRQAAHRRPLYMILVLWPFWTSILVKSFAFTVILGDAGLINMLLHAVDLPALDMMFNRFSVLAGTTNYLVPFAVFPILTNLLSQDPNLRKAAEVVGAGPLRIFWQITLPLSGSGVLAGFILTFVLSLGLFATPALLGGRRDMMMANLIDFYTRDTLNWNAASAIAVILLLTSAALILLLARVRGSSGPG